MKYLACAISLAGAMQITFDPVAFYSGPPIALLYLYFPFILLIAMALRETHAIVHGLIALTALLLGEMNLWFYYDYVYLEHQDMGIISRFLTGVFQSSLVLCEACLWAAYRFYIKRHPHFWH